MADGQNHQDGVTENLRKQLSLAVRSIQWSYAIFWSISSKQPGALEWGDGYYNGDIKTRKTVQATDLKADQLGLQRTEQLRELYESLSTGETSPQAKRPSAALSPEDLTDTEWYFLVCMSFVFDIGQGLPGRSLANNQTIWLCNAHYADSKVFSRSLLAKSASIQTVVCFPHLGGVVELGITDLIKEDINLIQHIKTSFLGSSCATASRKTTKVSGNTENEKDTVRSKLMPVEDCRERYMCSPCNSSNGLSPDRLEEESFMAEGINGETSQAQSLQFIDDETSNSVHNSIDSCDSISQTCINPEKAIPVPCAEKVHGDFPVDYHEDNHAKSAFPSKDMHYEGVLSTLLKTSNQLVLGHYFQNTDKKSSFVSWRKGKSDIHMPQIYTHQKLLKKVLFGVAKMHGGCLLESKEERGTRNGQQRPEIDELDTNHVLAERKRREKLNERFSALGSLVPSSCKVDKLSILDYTIEHLKELERRVEELEAGKEVAELEARRKPHDAAERISDNYVNNKLKYNKKPLTNKRKASEVDELESQQNQQVLLRDNLTDDVTVSIIEKDVLIEVRCSWRESLLLEIMDAISHLPLDSHSVESSKVDGVFSMIVRSKLKGSKVASIRTIRRALQRVVREN